MKYRKKGTNNSGSFEETDLLEHAENHKIYMFIKYTDASKDNLDAFCLDDETVWKSMRSYRLRLYTGKVIVE